MMHHIGRIDLAAETCRGSREVNEDACAALASGLPPSILGLLAVADGIGGLGNGHIASSTALTALTGAFSQLAITCSREEEQPVAECLASCFQEANAAVLRMTLATEELRGMGSTLTAAAITGAIVYICHVGDSRAYLWRNGRLRQITKDDWIQGRVTSADPAEPRTNRVTFVTQAIGMQPFIAPNNRVEPVEPGDGILLCTDGLTDSLSASDIETLVGQGGSAADICARLVDEAAQTPHADNISVAFAHLEPAA